MVELAGVEPAEQMHRLDLLAYRGVTQCLRAVVLLGCY